MQLKMNTSKSNNESFGFTIIELLIVIVIVGILAAIVVASYVGMSKKATEASLVSELDGAKRQLELYKTEYESYPTAMNEDKCPTAPTIDAKYCLKNKEFEYTTTDNGLTYNLKLTKSDITFQITGNTTPQVALTGPSDCPAGFVLVPGSVTYGTSNFCVMKYEAKADDNNDGIGDNNQTTNYNTWPANTYPISASRKLVSTAEGYPVANISQTAATTAASSFTKDCIGCHIISEAEWMTIAQNVLSVGNNWSSGTVGSGYVFSGHNDNSPATAIVANTNDSLNYFGTGNSSGDATVTSGMVGNTQRRTLALSNGNIIWDLAGDVYEWTSGQVTGGQPGITGGGFNWREYPALTNAGSLSVNITPASTGIVGSGSWNRGNGIGSIFSNSDDVALRGFRRGGCWNCPSYSGVLYLILSNAPSNSGTNVGFRVSAPAF